ncbi:hypothetical protein [Nonomuraea sediminis]|uniref:hypothetical protein n=1 Tax=Nonomuraea sediminis TaxID=2835864 RepID=UPI001BDD2A94|nr:hypothetical protein [Nonomuraea sediminis]
MRLLRRDDHFPQIESVEVTPPTVLLGEPFAITVATSENGPRDTVTGTLSGPGGEQVRLRFARTGESDFEQAWEAESTISDGRGKWQVDVAIGEDSAETSFEVADRTGTVETRIRGFAVEPETVDPGDLLTFTGRLERAAGGDDWSSLPDGQPILVSFRADDEYAWHVITETKTGEGGRFTATATAVESGLWRAEFQGGGDLRATRSAETRSTVRRSVGDVSVSHGRTPKKVHRGKIVTHSGTVRYWTGNGWSVVSNRSVLLRVDGTDHPDLNDDTDSHGRYKITEHAQVSGGRVVVFRKQGQYSAGQSTPERPVTVT